MKDFFDFSKGITCEIDSQDKLDASIEQWYINYNRNPKKEYTKYLVWPLFNTMDKYTRLD